MKGKVTAMKKWMMIILVLAVSYCTINPVFSCTSFAVYSEEAVYGMNFDFPETELRFVVEQGNDMNVFFMQFKEGNSYQPTVGMNEKGLFASIQMQYPQITGQNGRGSDELFVPELAGYIGEHNHVKDVLQALERKTLVQLRDLTLHNLLADPEENAVITEVGENGNELLPCSGNFIVMTNFKNSDFKDKPYDKITGTGADRYIKVYNYISENMEHFDSDKALEGLKMTVQHKSFPTLSSMVFVPSEKCVYVALHRNFDKLWKISIADKTIETFKGFDINLKYRIPQKGILASDLIHDNYEKVEPYEDNEPVATVKNTAGSENQKGTFQKFIIIIGAIVFLLLACFLLAKRSKK